MNAGMDPGSEQGELSPRQLRQLDEWEAQEHLAEEHPELEAGS